MKPVTPAPSVVTTSLPQFNLWLVDRIRQLSVDALSSATFTCTACGEHQGTYIIKYKDSTFRFNAAETYAFLKFMTE